MWVPVAVVDAICVCASDSGRLPLALTAELRVDVSRGCEGPPWESGGESSEALRFCIDACMGVAGLFESASSGNISSSSAEDCICESPSTSMAGRGCVSSSLGRFAVDMVVEGIRGARVSYQTWCWEVRRLDWVAVRLFVCNGRKAAVDVDQALAAGPMSSGCGN